MVKTYIMWPPKVGFNLLGILYTFSPVLK